MSNNVDTKLSTLLPGMTIGEAMEKGEFWCPRRSTEYIYKTYGSLSMGELLDTKLGFVAVFDKAYDTAFNHGINSGEGNFIFLMNIKEEFKHHLNLDRLIKGLHRVSTATEWILLSDCFNIVLNVLRNMDRIEGIWYDMEFGHLYGFPDKYKPSYKIGREVDLEVQLKQTKLELLQEKEMSKLLYLKTRKTFKRLREKIDQLEQETFSSIDQLFKKQKTEHSE